jgi:DNA polymerase-3 subunit delta'
VSSTPIGHEREFKELAETFSRGRSSHAYLFVGPDGVGKRTVARRLIQRLLCESGAIADVEPCGLCPACAQFESGVHPDFAEIGVPEEKNELPIESIRELIGRLGCKSSRGGFKGALIDDADLMNASAANSLLKTLEEPPPRSVLILISSDSESMLDTILSRCQLVRFRPIDRTRLAEALTAGGHVADRHEAMRIATWADGSFGDAIELTSPAIREFRAKLRTGLARLPAGVVELSDQIAKEVDSAGKSASARRRRLKRLIRFAVDFYREAIWLRETGRSPSQVGATDSTSLDHFDQGAQTTAERQSIEQLLDLLERCVDADVHVSRFLNQSLTIDCWIDDLAQISSGLIVPRVGTAY